MSPVLTDRQREILEMIWDYHHLTHKGAPATVVAFRLGLSEFTVRFHYAALHRKGHLKSAGSPAVPYPIENP